MDRGENLKFLPFPDSGPSGALISSIGMRGMISSASWAMGAAIARLATKARQNREMDRIVQYQLISSGYVRKLDDGVTGRMSQAQIDADRRKWVVIFIFVENGPP